MFVKTIVRGLDSYIEDGVCFTFEMGGAQNQGGTVSRSALRLQSKLDSHLWLSVLHMPLGQPMEIVAWQVYNV